MREADGLLRISPVVAKLQREAEAGPELLGRAEELDACDDARLLERVRDMLLADAKCDDNEEDAELLKRVEEQDADAVNCQSRRQRRKQSC